MLANRFRRGSRKVVGRIYQSGREKRNISESTLPVWRPRVTWEIVPRFAGTGIAKKTITVFKDEKGWRLFLPKNMRDKFGDSRYVDLYADGYKLMLKFLQKKGNYSRRLANGAVRLPLYKLGIKLEGGITRLDILPEMGNGELIIDFGQYREKEIK